MNNGDLLIVSLALFTELSLSLTNSVNYFEIACMYLYPFCLCSNNLLKCFIDLLLIIANTWYLYIGC